MFHENVKKTYEAITQVPSLQTPASARFDQIQMEKTWKKIRFSKARRGWGILEWRKVLFSVEPPFELCHHQNPQRYRVWACSKEDAEPTETVNFF